MIDHDGAEAILLGGTDLILVFDSNSSPFPIIDCAAIHAEAIARRALGVLSDRNTNSVDD